MDPMDKTDVDLKATFKKPVLIGKVGRLLQRKIIPVPVNAKEQIIKDDDVVEEIELNVSAKDETVKEDEDLQEKQKKSASVLRYEEPPWAGLPSSPIEYQFEVLKSGLIIDKINLMKKSFLLFGRLENCDIYMAHPTISRYHAILQYKAIGSDDRPIGYYIYDLGSTHGTFLNKNRIKPKVYVRLQVGHMLKLGCSTRTYLLIGPENDTEAESELSVTELKAKRAEELRLREEVAARERHERDEAKKKEEAKGIDWGMGEDADEDTDLSENPFAETANEQLYLDDPKKALRGFFEREGLELQYECTERGIGQFLCSVVLPLDDAKGKSIVAEALVKGKKKEAVVQCALEACRILDRHGVLRQATHESRKRKARNWDENDYYDSDEDTFLDRTGTIERKREKRMKATQSQQPETYQTLIEKEQKLSDQIRAIEKQLSNVSKPENRTNSSPDDLDPLDQFMTELSSNKPDKFTIGKLKTDLTRLRKEHTEIVKLVNIARPAHLPPLIIQPSHSQASTSGAASATPKKTLPMFGKRFKVKVTVPQTITSAAVRTENEDGEEVEEEEEEVKEIEDVVAVEEEPVAPLTRKGLMKQLEHKVAHCDGNAFAALDAQTKAKISKTVTKLRKIAEEEERIVVDKKRLAVQHRKIFEQINAVDQNDSDKCMKLSQALARTTDEFSTIGGRKEKLVDKINQLADDINTIATDIKATSEKLHEESINRMKEFVEKTCLQQTKIFYELQDIEITTIEPQVLAKLTELHEWLNNQKTAMLNNLEKLKTLDTSSNNHQKTVLDDILEFELKSDKFITTILTEINKTPPPEKEPSGVENECVDDDATERRKKKNLRRIMQRLEKAETEKNKLYEEDAKKEDYNMWVPPQGQTGDGRTSLNEKFGY